MSSRLANAPLEIFCASWRPNWRGPHRVAMLTASLADPRRFVAYGTDGFTAFRVEGTWFADLKPFLDLVDLAGAELVPPPSNGAALMIGEPTFPDLLTVQCCFDAMLGKAAA